MAVSPKSPVPPFSTFFGQEAPAVARLLSALVPAAEVEELVQETFLAALKAYDGFDGRNPRGWVMAIARRKAIDAHRARARKPAAGELAEEAIEAPGAELPQLGGIWADVADLPPKQRAALLMRYALDMPHREIGVALDCSEAAARRNVHEGISTLRKRASLGEARPEPQEARR